tara:strand:- start:431 stop:607 length:177 start_codon:yes stop_codon:yes gene_type:complete
MKIAMAEKAKAAYWSQCVPVLSNPFLSKSELLNFPNFFYSKKNFLLMLNENHIWLSNL